jgi:hypothetical protein
VGRNKGVAMRINDVGNFWRITAPNGCYHWYFNAFTGFKNKLISALTIA